MYRQFISEAERQKIIAEYGKYGKDTPPHCNDKMFHEPGVCAYCDGFYKLNPGFTPPSYVTPEAYGWGGNAAPIVDDDAAAEEDEMWRKALEGIT
jgi:hypothetical protein